MATLGKWPGMDTGAQGWEKIERLLEGGADPTVELGSEEPAAAVSSRLGAGGSVRACAWNGCAISAKSIWRCRCGGAWGCTAACRTDRRRDARGAVGTDGLLLTVARFCGQKSELEVAERWYADSALEDLLGVPLPQINDARLYRGLDVLHAHKEELCAHLHGALPRAGLACEFEFLLYDVTSTYFEGKAAQQKGRARLSRDQRPDCKQVNIGLVVTPEGLPHRLRSLRRQHRRCDHGRGDGRADGEKYGSQTRSGSWTAAWSARRTSSSCASAAPATSSARPRASSSSSKPSCWRGDWNEVQPGVEVKLVAHPDGEGSEQYVLCRSERAAAEGSRPCLNRSVSACGRKLEQDRRAACARRPAKDAGAIERRIGRWLGRYPAAERLFEVSVESRPKPDAPCGLENHRTPERAGLGAHAHGAYLLAHQLHGERSRATLAMVHPAEPGRRLPSASAKAI